jgi:hypothetical protein
MGRPLRSVQRIENTGSGAAPVDLPGDFDTSLLAR